MTVFVLSENLQKKLPFLNRAVSSRSQLPILLNLLLEAREGKLRISATDLEIGILTEIPANIEKEGKVTVPARFFSELINSLPQEKIKIEQQGNTLVVTGKNAKSVFQTANPDDFPNLYQEKGEEVFKTEIETFKKIFGPVIFSASQDLSKPALSGVLIKERGEGSQRLFSIAATDGYRLSLKSGNLEGNGQKSQAKTILIPVRLIKEAFGIGQQGEPIVMSVSSQNNQVMFFCQDTIFVGRLIEAEFPNYERIIPKDYVTRVEIDREVFQRAIKTSSVFARDAGNVVRLSLRKEAVVVSANTPSVGENTVEIEAKLEGEENEIAFNVKYLQDLLSNLEGENIVLELVGPLNPGVFKVAGDASFLHIIMPIRVKAE